MAVVDKRGRAQAPEPRYSTIPGPGDPLRPIPTAARRRLGKDSDQDIARQFRILSELVAAHRARAGIPAAFGQLRIRWTSAMLSDLKNLGVVAMARRYSLSVEMVRVKRAHRT